MGSRQRRERIWGVRNPGEQGGTVSPAGSSQADRQMSGHGPYFVVEGRSPCSGAGFTGEQETPGKQLLQGRIVAQ